MAPKKRSAAQLEAADQQQRHARAPDRDKRIAYIGRPINRNAAGTTKSQERRVNHGRTYDKHGDCSCVGMYGWDVVTGLCSIQGMVGAMMDANADEWCPVCGHA